MNQFPEKYNITNWLPVTKKELEKHSWEQVDVILFTGDAYIDHPSFGAAVIGRVLEAEGYKVAIVPQPNWRDDLRDFKKFGKPKLLFAVTSGNMDSMINHYTANKRLRSNDAYTTDGKSGLRPDYALTVYSNIIKDIYPDIPLIIGGIEASLRRLTHYDYWQNKLLPSSLISTKADLLIYGMGEKAIRQVSNLLAKGVDIKNIKNISQTAYVTDIVEYEQDCIYVHSHKTCVKDKKKFAQNFKVIETESNRIQAKKIIQKYNEGKIIVINPPNFPLTEKEIDKNYDLPFTRLPHPKYWGKGDIPAYEMIKHSINIHRGCFGGCSFCTISAHQGKFVSSRSEKSILKELEKIIAMPDFKGYISDIGGPSANMYQMKGVNLNICSKCIRPSCIYPDFCKNLDTNHFGLQKIYEKIRNHPKIKKATIGSGIRLDLALHQSKDKGYIEDVISFHISGRLKVAPEHTSEKVLKLMRKPNFESFIKFKNIFDKINESFNLNQQIIPYFISSHPICTEEDMAELAVTIKHLNIMPEQIQDFTPTPMTMSAVIFYSGYHPYTMEKIYSAKSKNEKLAQRKYFFWYKKEFLNEIKNSLIKLNRKDLLQKLLR